MGSLILLMIVAAAAYVWLRRMRASRQRWLSRLALPGIWSCETPQGHVVLEFVGGPDHGGYVETVNHASERGRWRIEGNRVVFACDAAETSCELRLFDNGSIGIDGPGRERRVYVRQKSNVVPLRQRR